MKFSYTDSSSHSCLLHDAVSPGSNSGRAYPGLWQKINLAICFVLLLSASGCSRTPAGSIERVLNQCADISAAASRVQGDAAKAGYVADHFQALDTSGCPEDFRVAFQMHVNAWRQAQLAYANNNFGNNFVEGAVAGFTGNTSNVGATMGAAAQAGQDINATYYELTAIAAKYGARIPRSVVQ